MECNRDEALRAKSIAEAKIEKKDYAGAKKFALKAQSLYPVMDGISQMMDTVNVLISAENKIGGEIDWYGVLGVNPSDDDETIKKQYRKLALVLHPDKNKSVGADGAFKLISEAWSLLSDKTKRLSYNQRRGGSRGFQQKAPMHHGGPSAAPAPRENGNFMFSNRTASVPKTQKNSVKPPQPQTTAPPPCQRSDTFWTICHQCKMHYEYLKIYLNQTLLCPNCHKAFMASATAPPYNYSSKPQNRPSQQRRHPSSDRNPGRNAYDLGRDAPGAQKPGPGQAGSNSYSYTYYNQVPQSGTANMGGGDPSIAAKAANVVQQAQDKLKRAHTDSLSSSGWSEQAKKRYVDSNNSSYGMQYNTTQGNGGTGTASVSAPGSRIYGFSSTSRPVARELTPFEVRKLLIERARKEIQAKINLWEKEKETSGSSKRVRHEDTSGVKRSHQNGNSDLSATKIANQSKEDDTSLSEDEENTNHEDSAAASISVPDPDFYDFDQDRSESSFEENEVWAGYDDDDGMPRIYALISKVTSRKPFKLRVSWLKSKSNNEFSSIDWVGSGFYKTCGEFRVGRYETCKSINSFSQKVNWSKGPRGSILIYPQKGDVWALYKNWSPEWNENIPDEVVHKYDMVMVLDNYNEEQGISVTPLEKVIGFKTVFRPNMDPNAIKRIPREEMFRFSHRVPNHILTGQEAPNAPKGCLELDPAATPLELLQVMTGHEVPTVPDTANTDGEVSSSIPSSNLDGNIDKGGAAPAVNLSENSLEVK